MSDQVTTPPKGRSRASRACQKCSQRKVRCDATESGLPCSRCRLDANPNCALTFSRRGTYQRKKIRLDTTATTTIGAETSARRVSVCDLETESEASTPSTSISSHRPSISTQGIANNQLVADQPSEQQCFSVSLEPAATATTSLHDSSVVSRATGSDGEALESNGTARLVSTDRNETGMQAGNRNSLAAMFEDFLDNQGHTQDGVVPKLGVIFFSESSPLTFALEELQRSERRSLHDPIALLNGEAMAHRTTHPPHMSPQDIGYLQSKGAFESPNPEISTSLVAAFLERFYPLYSIVDKGDFMALHEKQGLPWVLLHAVCFIGATFCETSTIYKAGFKSRWHARGSFYDKAKILFDVGYETNKVVLLQTVLMLSFWGPQMKSYWNPCSWIGFGVTIAESLGINRRNPSTWMDSKAKSLLRRLWWTLAVRDAYCAALLGRPFRINIFQCDTDMLDLTDFDHDVDCPITNKDPDCHGHCVYQIQIAKLSLVLRKIVELRFGPPDNSTTLQDLHEMSNRWQAELPQEVDWSLQSASGSNNIFATSLRIIFNHHLIFIHLNKPSFADDVTTGLQYDSSAFQIAESAAQMISSTALSLMTNSMVEKMPHETFPGFFIAGIVFYRQYQQSQQSRYAQMGRAALDNCRMVMNEARERWDPALWAMKIFDFLLSGPNNHTKTPGLGSCQSTSANGLGLGDEGSAELLPQDTQDNSGSATMGIANKNILHAIDFESPQYEDLNKTCNEFLLMPSYFGATPDIW